MPRKKAARAAFHLNDPALLSAPPMLMEPGQWRELLDDIERRKAQIAERALARLVEIEQERAQILGAFPDLKRRLKDAAPPVNGREVKRAEVLFDAAAAPASKPAKPAPRNAGQRVRHPPEVKAAAVERVRKGEYAYAVADDIGCSTGAVVTWCEAAGVKPRMLSPEEARRRSIEARQRKAAERKAAQAASHPEPEPGSNRKKYDAETIRIGMERVRNGERIADVERDLGFAKSSLQYYLRKAGHTGKQPPNKGGSGADRSGIQEQQDRKITIPTLRYIAGKKYATSRDLAKKFGISLSGARGRFEVYSKRGLLNANAPGVYEVTEAGIAMIKETEQ